MKKKKENTNFQFAIDVAQGFYNTGITLAKESNKRTEKGHIWIPPGVVNLSFATELLLKATIFYDLRKRAFGHKLFELYKSLSEETRLKIEEYYSTHREVNEKEKSLPSYKIIVREEGTEKKKNISKANSEKSNFQEIKNLLEIHSEAFENWRYLYEFGNEGYCYEFDFNAMDAFYKALIDILRDLLSNTKKTYGMYKV